MYHNFETFREEDSFEWSFTLKLLFKCYTIFVSMSILDGSSLKHLKTKLGHEFSRPQLTLQDEIVFQEEIRFSFTKKFDFWTYGKSRGHCATSSHWLAFKLGVVGSRLPNCDAYDTWCFQLDCYAGCVLQSFKPISKIQENSTPRLSEVSCRLDLKWSLAWPTSFKWTTSANHS